MASTLRKKHKMFGGFTGYYEHESSCTKTKMNFSVFVPELKHGQKAPVVYFLAGLTCTEENFMIKAGAQKNAADLGLILVTCDTSPRGLVIPGIKDSWDFGEGAGFYVNATQSPWSTNFKMYDYVLTELPKLIEAEFPAHPSKRSIMGHSMGGHGALVIGLRNPEEFTSISAFSPISSPTRCPWGEKALTNYLGSKSPAWNDYDASLLIEKASKKIPILIDQGIADEFLEKQLKPELLTAAAIKVDYPINLRMQPGYDHSYYFISTFIKDHLEFHMRYF
jgi:S-formylglutathione hydrolase